VVQSEGLGAWPSRAGAEPSARFVAVARKLAVILHRMWLWLGAALLST
jgi:hypothetical protein